MMIRNIFFSLVTTLLLIACGGGDNEPSQDAQSTLSPDGLTKAQLVNGIGPVKDMKLSPLDEGLAAQGKDIFDLKCIACHKIDDRLVGPPLAKITERRTPAFIMNMILNPDEMVKKHPAVKAMLAEYYVPMTFQNVSEQDARALLEYLRTL